MHANNGFANYKSANDKVENMQELKVCPTLSRYLDIYIYIYNIERSNPLKSFLLLLFEYLLAYTACCNLNMRRIQSRIDLREWVIFSNRAVVVPKERSI